MKTRIAAALLACTLAACSDDAANPVAPSAPRAVPGAAEAPTLLREPGDPGISHLHGGGFDQGFYDEIIYGYGPSNSWGEGEPTNSNYLVPDIERTRFTVYLNEWHGLCTIPPASINRWRTMITNATGHLLWQGTGRYPSIAIIETRDRAMAERAMNTRGEVLVRFEHHTMAGCDNCAGYAGLGGPMYPGWSHLTLTLGNNCLLRVPQHLELELYAHELGHVLGAFHVSTGNHVMRQGHYSGLADFSPGEKHHLQRAYAALLRGERRRGHTLAPDGVVGPLPPPIVVVD